MHTVVSLQLSHASIVFVAATDLKNAPGAVYPGPPEGVSPDCTLTISDEDFQAMLSGALNAQKVNHAHVAS